MFTVLTDFITELRAAGVPVSMVEAIDAMQALEHVDLAERSALKAALGATLVKNARHQRAFDTAFEVFFALHRPKESDDQVDAGRPTGGSPGQNGGTGSGEADLDGLIESIYRALAASDWAGLQAAAARAVDELAGIERGRPVGGTYYLYRTMRRLDIESMHQRLLQVVMEEAGMPEGLEARLLREETDARIVRLRQEIQAEIRRRLVADRGPESVARTLRQPLVEDLDLMHANREDLRALEQVIDPLTRKLAARLARRRRLLRHGRLDFRRTMRRSLATGGVPVDPVFRGPRPHKPEVFLMCDVSGSMATFARFTLQFTYAMANQFAKLRSFVFIDNVDEVTHLFGPGIDFNQALARITTEAEVVWLDGHSDYGNSFWRFGERYGGDLTSRSTLIITGDARNNYRPPRAEILGDLARSARAVYWLNPEPRSYWDTGDSVMGRYQGWCDGVFEVRTLRQLEDFIEKATLPPLGRRLAQPLTQR
jgi:uncharacterized protein